jgi:hypothetical protein
MRTCPDHRSPAERPAVGRASTRAARPVSARPSMRHRRDRFACTCSRRGTGIRPFRTGVPLPASVAHGSPACTPCWSALRRRPRASFARPRSGRISPRHAARRRRTQQASHRRSRAQTPVDNTTAPTDLSPPAPRAARRSTTADRSARPAGSLPQRRAVAGNDVDVGTPAAERPLVSPPKKDRLTTRIAHRYPASAAWPRP